MQFTIPFPAKFDPNEHDAGFIHDWLTQRGVVVEGISIGQDAITIEADSDPRDTIRDYDPPLTPRQKAKAALLELNDVNLDTATTAELRRALKLIRGLLNYEIRYD